jgi:hypothetical protein
MKYQKKETNTFVLWECHLDIKLQQHIGHAIKLKLYFLKSKTKTVPSEADAPTLSPRLFQHTSKMPPVPL